MIFATMGNTSATITNTLIDLIVYPEIKKKIIHEIEQQLKKEKMNLNANGELYSENGNYYISQEMIDGMEYLDQCITETIRLKAPPVHIRKIQTDLYAENGNTLIPRNNFVCVSPWVR